MKYDPDKHHRRSIRLQEYDYSTIGAYFVTICAQGRACLFGEVRDGAMWLNDAGRMVSEGWLKLPGKFPAVALDEHMIMPNHFHGIICIVGAPLAAPDFELRHMNKGAEITNQGAASSAPTLGSIMRVFKSMSAIDVNRVLDRSGVPVWQRNYYERVIRDERELDAARKYILENPIKWHLDRENPANAQQTTNNT